MKPLISEGVKSMKPISKTALLLFACILLTHPCFAAVENWQASPWTKEKTYVEKSVGKLGFGILNVLTGWSALFFEPVRYSNTNIFTGVAKGLWRSVTNTAGGGLHAVTFFIPVDIPLPDGGVHFDETPHGEDPDEANEAV